MVTPAAVVPVTVVNGTKTRTRLAAYLACGLILTIMVDAVIGYFAMNAPEAFKNWELVTSILSSNATAKTALISGLLGFMAHDVLK